MGVTDISPHVVEQGLREARRFLASINCYDLCPTSGKVLLVDVALNVQSAFRAFIEHGSILLTLRPQLCPPVGPHAQ